MSASARLESPISRTCSLLSTEVTPKTRSAAFLASRFWRKLPTVPRSVIVPLSAETAIASGSIFGSQKSSSLTSATRSSFDIVVLLSFARAAAPPSGQREPLRPMSVISRVAASAHSPTSCGKDESRLMVAVVREQRTSRARAEASYTVGLATLRLPRPSPLSVTHVIFLTTFLASGVEAGHAGRPILIVPPPRHDG